mmetsp:Transcript_61821/g.119103  ORF Transcript_61821/g.119103 Transcript_61821/m.119103 type:complete len:621 (+) Transcript_61821:106-1968(+)
MSFQIIGQAFSPATQTAPPPADANELNAFNLLRKFTGDRRDVQVEAAYLQLGRLRAMLSEFEEYNGTFVEEQPNADLAAFCRARVVELLSSLGLRPEALVGLDDLNCLITAIEAVCNDRLLASQERVAAGRVEFFDLAELFSPKSKALGPAGGLSQEMAYLVRSCHFEEHSTPFGKKHSFTLEFEFFASVGSCFAAVRCQEQVGWWRGVRQIDGLPIQPLPRDLDERLTTRGKVYAEVAAGAHFLNCRPGTFLGSGGRSKGRFRGGRVMVDIDAAMESGQKPVISGHSDAAPSALEAQTEYFRRAIRQGRLEKRDPAVQRDEAAGLLLIDRMVFFNAIPARRLWNCWPLVPAYCFSSKAWGHAEVAGLSPIEWEDGAWDALVLPAERKALIKAVVQRQREVGSIDLIKGKGEGTTFLLYGPPGTGKTLTAEAMAEVLHKPLYVLSAGEMGTTPAELESTLAEALQLCSRWDCLCLIDEADIFLEERGNGTDVTRNALVCVMLRQLEYHPGVLFLTTNKAKGIDAAVLSRLTLALRYEPLDVSARLQIWDGLLGRIAAQPGRVKGSFDAGALAAQVINGRQIKNVMRLSLALAMDQGVELTEPTLLATLDAACAAQRELSE